MNVPPFIPSQIVIPGNVAEERYDVRVRFVKRVAILQTVSVAVALALSMMPWAANIPFRVGMTAFLVGLLGLSLVRGLVKRWRHEQRLSAVFVPLVIGGLAVVVRSVTIDSGYPLWIFGLPSLGHAVYVAVCGRDLSFTGMFVLVSSGITAFVLGASRLYPGEQPYSMLWLGMVAYTAFFTYDLAAIQTRRRLGEEMGAVLDLYRDLLNFTTYPVRVIQHWRRHRIWSVR